jgi:hypothetical protein
VLNAKMVLRCFELAFGLKINFHKSCIVQVGVPSSIKSSRWAKTFRYKNATLPISYLGFVLGGMPGAKDF